MALAVKCIAFFFTVLWSLLIAVRITFAILKNPVAALKRKIRNIPPACLLDPSLGTHEYVTANGIKFHYVAAGDRSKPLMLFLHGFPEFWYSWRHQMREFSKDYRVVAVDLRGYAETEKPPNKSDYVINKLTDDVKELIPSLGYEKCTLVAHDWGGVLAWFAVQHYPDLFDKAIIMNCPHSKVMSRQIRSGWTGQLMKSWYVFMFQMPYLPEFVIRLFDYRMLNSAFRDEDGGARNKNAFSDEDIEAFKYTFSQPGALTPPINYYRNVFNDPVSSKVSGKKTIDIPVLLIWGDDDAFLEATMADKHGDVCSNITVRHIPDCSHWVQQDRPELVNQYMREFL